MQSTTHAGRIPVSTAANPSASEYREKADQGKNSAGRFGNSTDRIGMQFPLKWSFNLPDHTEVVEPKVLDRLDRTGNQIGLDLRLREQSGIELKRKERAHQLFGAGPMAIHIRKEIYIDTEAERVPFGERAWGKIERQQLTAIRIATHADIAAGHPRHRSRIQRKRRAE